MPKIVAGAFRGILPVALLASLFVALGSMNPAGAEPRDKACRVEVDGKTYASGSCEINIGSFGAAVRWADTGYLYLDETADGEFTGLWTGPTGGSHATETIEAMRYADGCWINQRATICFESAKELAAELAQRLKEKEDATPGLMAFLLLALALYMLPSLIAFIRRHPNRWVILILNAVCGVTVIVWLGCLVWACKAVHLTDDPQGSNGGESGLNVLANDVARVRVDPPLLAPPPCLPAGLMCSTSYAALRDQGVLDEAEFLRLKQGVMERVFPSDSRAG